MSLSTKIAPIFLLVALGAFANCCKRDDFHHIKITEKATHLDDEKPVIAEYAISGEGITSRHDVYLPLEGPSPCRQNVQRYEEELQRASVIKIHNHVIEALREGDVQGLPDLHQIDLSDNVIVEVQSKVFLQVPELSVVNLSHNNITSIPSDAFENLPKLQEVDLGHNQLQEWNPDWFASNSKIRDVSVSYNELTHLPHGAFDKIRDSIEKLDFSHNKIQAVDAALFAHLHKLRSLALNNNDLKCLDQEVLDALPKSVALSIAPNNNINCLCWSRIQTWSLNNYDVNKDTVFHTVRHSEVRCHLDIVHKLDEVLERISALEKH